MLTRLAHTFLLLGLLSLLYPNFSHASQPPQPAPPTPAAAQQSNGEWLLQTFDQQNNPIASVPLVIATKHEGFLPVAVICGAKSMRVQGVDAQLLEVETITVWPDARLCKITVKAPGFPGEHAPQREEKLKPGDLVSFIQDLEKNSKNMLTGHVLNRDSFLGATEYDTGITYDPTLIGKRVFDEFGNLVGFGIQVNTSCQPSRLITVRSTIAEDLSAYQAELFDTSKWASLQVHVNEADIVRVLFAEGVIRASGVQNVADALSSCDNKLDVSKFVMFELMSVINNADAWGIGRDIPQMILNSDPDSEYAKLTQGITQGILKEYDQASITLQNLIESKVPEIAMSSQYHLAISLVQAGKKNAAKVQVEKLHARFPGQVSILRLMSGYYQEVKDTTSLERVSYELLSIDWTKCHLLGNAQYLAEAGMRAPVIKIMSELVVRWPEDTNVRAVAAKYFDEYRMKEKVLEILRAGVKSHAATSKDWQLLYTYEHNYKDPHAKVTVLDWQEKAPSTTAFMIPATMLILNENDCDKAFEMLRRGYSLYSRDLEYLLFYTMILVDNKKLQEALEVTSKTIHEFPEDFFAKVLHAFALMANGDLEMAKKLCEEVLESDPQHADALFMMAYLYKSQDNRVECEKMLQRINSLPPLKVKQTREKWNKVSFLNITP